MNDPVVRLEGARELRAALKALGDDLADLSDVNQAVGLVVADAARPKIPVRSGALAASVRVARTKTSATIRFGGARVPYANAIHWGTGPRVGLRGPHNIAPSLFATEAASETEPQWTDLYLTRVEQLVDKAIERSNHT